MLCFRHGLVALELLGLDLTEGQSRGRSHRDPLQGRMEQDQTPDRGASPLCRLTGPGGQARRAEAKKESVFAVAKHRVSVHGPAANSWAGVRYPIGCGAAGGIPPAGTGLEQTERTRTGTVHRAAKSDGRPGGQPAGRMRLEPPAIFGVRAGLCLGYPSTRPANRCAAQPTPERLAERHPDPAGPERDTFGRARGGKTSSVLRPQVQLRWIPSGDTSFKPAPQHPGSARRRNWAKQAGR